MSEEANQDNHNEQALDPQGPSQRLCAARLELGLSQKEVADQLFLTTNFIQYIDEGEFDRFPKPAFVKGYLRTYARVVGLSGDEMVALYEAELQAATPTPEIRGVTEEKVGTAAITGPVLQSGLIGLAGLFAVILVVWFLVSDDDSATTISVSAVEKSNSGPSLGERARFDAPQDTLADEEPGFDGSTSMVDGAADDASPDIEDNTSANDSANQLAPAIDNFQAESLENERLVITGDSELLQSDEAAAEETASDASVDFERTSDGNRSVIKVDAGGFDQLVLSFTDECWVEVSDSERGLVYNDLNRADDIVTVYGQAPFRVLLGKATVVEMIYNGRPFDLAEHTEQDNTAKFTVAD